MTVEDAEAELLNDIYRRFVHMVLYARKGEGTWSDDDELRAFTVHLGDVVTICINDEPHGFRPARTVRAIAEGETLAFCDVVVSPAPRPVKLKPPYVAGELTATGWRVRFNFSRQHPRAGKLLETGDEFLAVAEDAVATGRLRVFVENAFHAAESFAKAELLSYPVSSAEVEDSKTHTSVQSAYDLWARLDNTDKRFPGLLRALRAGRKSATYAASTFVPNPELAAQHLATLRDLRDAAHGAVRRGRRGINVIATREIMAGMLIDNSDVTLRPSKRKPSS